MYPNDMRHVPRSLLLIECARASVDLRTVRKLLAGLPVTGAARERAQRVIDRLSLTADMIPLPRQQPQKRVDPRLRPPWSSTAKKTPGRQAGKHSKGAPPYGAACL